MHVFLLVNLELDLKFRKIWEGTGEFFSILHLFNINKINLHWTITPILSHPVLCIWKVALLCLPLVNSHSIMALLGSLGVSETHLLEPSWHWAELYHKICPRVLQLLSLICLPQWTVRSSGAVEVSNSSVSPQNQTFGLDIIDSYSMYWQIWVTQLLSLYYQKQSHFSCNHGTHS